MKINYNMSAYVANSQLQRNESSLTQSLERLSSGYRINHASDDPAGMAISAKMKAQIKGLDQAERNSSDGISIIETAEGALQEVTTILQRMRELAVQAGNDTYGDDDREAMQDEIEALKEEIDRISTDTEFNKKNLLDGSLCSRIYSDTKSVDRVQVENVACGIYQLELTSDAAHAEINLNNMTAAAPPKGEISINNVSVKFDGTESSVEFYTRLRDAGEKAEVSIAFEDANNDGVYTYGEELKLKSLYTGQDEVIDIEAENSEMGNYFGLNVGGVASISMNANGQDVGVALVDGFTSQATVITDGNMVSITDLNGFKMSFDITEGSFAGGLTNFDLEVTRIGDMTFQVGANQYQTISVDIPDMSVKSLRLETLDVTTVFGTDKGLQAIDDALSRVSSVRSSLGATENRLNYTVDTLSETQVDMTSALSRIEDVDMAEEMTTYTQNNVLVQAATSVLAQANDLPEQVLQLLQ